MADKLAEAREKVALVAVQGAPDAYQNPKVIADRILTALRYAELVEENERLRAALKAIAEHPHQDYGHPSNGSGEYGTGCADGHRCAGNIARRATAAEGGEGE